MNRRSLAVTLFLALFVIGVQISNAQYDELFVEPGQDIQIERRMSRTAKFRGEPIRFGKRSAYREPIRFGKRSSANAWTDPVY